MGIVKGLKSIKSYQDEQNARREAGGKKFPDRFFQIFPKRGDEIVVRFLQELDEKSPNYREDRGVGMIATEHQAGNEKRSFMTKALCSMDDEGECYGCERHKADYKSGWGIRTSLYINVLAEVDGELKPFVLDRNANSTFVQQLMEEASEEGSITNSNFKIKKTGADKQTQWMLRRLTKDEPLDDSNVEVWDIEGSILKDIKYADQPAFYGKAFDDNTTSSDSTNESNTSRPASDQDDEW
jgi:hypothetical protein